MTTVAELAYERDEALRSRQAARDAFRLAAGRVVLDPTHTGLEVEMGTALTVLRGTELRLGHLERLLAEAKGERESVR